MQLPARELQYRVVRWANSPTINSPPPSLRRLPREDAARWLTIAIEAVVENYREYRDYNTTTTHSDHGEMLFTLVDFLRLRAEYSSARLIPPSSSDMEARRASSRLVCG